MVYTIDIALTRNDIYINKFKEDDEEINTYIDFDENKYNTVQKFIDNIFGNNNKYYLSFVLSTFYWQLQIEVNPK